MRHLSALKRVGDGEAVGDVFRRDDPIIIARGLGRPLGKSDQKMFAEAYA